MYACVFNIRLSTLSMCECMCEKCNHTVKKSLYTHTSRFTQFIRAFVLYSVFFSDIICDVMWTVLLCETWFMRMFAIGWVKKCTSALLCQKNIMNITKEYDILSSAFKKQSCFFYWAISYVFYMYVYRNL